MTLKKILILLLATLTIINFSGCDILSGLSDNDDGLTNDVLGSSTNDSANSNSSGSEADKKGEYITAERLTMFLDAIKNSETDVVANMCGVYNEGENIKVAQFSYLKEIKIDKYYFEYIFSDGANYTYSVILSISESQNQQYPVGISKWKAVVPITDEISAVSQFVPYSSSVGIYSGDSDTRDMELFAYNWLCCYSDNPFISAENIETISFDSRLLDLISRCVEHDLEGMFTETSFKEYAKSVFGKSIGSAGAYSDFYQSRYLYYDDEKGNMLNGIPQTQKITFINLKEKIVDPITGRTEISYDIFSDCAYMNVCRRITFTFMPNQNGGFSFQGTVGEHVTEYSPAIISITK